MKARYSSVAGLVLSVCAAVLSAATIPGGNVSGTWYQANSPYYITGSITIPASDTLVIEPGVEVEFQGDYSLTVNGYLEAIGTEADSIHFTASTFWRGLNFSNAPDSSKLAFCTILHSGTFFTGMGGINCTNSNPVITHCRISDNYAHEQISTYAGGIALNNSNAEISWCDIRNNESAMCGGGLTITNSSPVITGCNISGNKTIMYGGGIYITGNSSPIITNCTIEANISNMYGGGISVVGGVITISECTIGPNRAYDGGGGIAIFGGSVSLDHCIVERNNCLLAADGKGGGIFTNGGVLTVDHCTFYGNEIDISNPYGMEIHTEGNAAMTVTNSIFLSSWNFCTIVFNSTVPASVSYDDFKGYEGSGTYRFMGNVPSGLGVLTQVNTNGDSCDQYYDIFIDPLFTDAANHDFHLAAGSPCIDAGDPAFAHDPDSTITDMGAYWYCHQLPVTALSDTVLDFGTVGIGEHADLTLTVYNRGTGNLVIRGVANSQPVFTTDYVPADSVVGPGDSLLITVTFTPADDSFVKDTLHLDNSDQNAAVALSGTGQYPVGVVRGREPEIRRFGLRQTGANPVGSGATFVFDLPRRTRVVLKVYSILGKEVATVVSGEMGAGSHWCVWARKGLPAGGYFFRLDAGNDRASGKFVLLR